MLINLEPDEIELLPGVVIRKLTKKDMLLGMEYTDFNPRLWFQTNKNSIQDKMLPNRHEYWQQDECGIHVRFMNQDGKTVTEGESHMEITSIPFKRKKDLSKTIYFGRVPKDANEMEILMNMLQL